MNELEPVGARVLITPFRAAEQSASGLIMENSTSNNAPVKGTVLKAGSKSDFHPGDEIFYRRYSLDELKIKTAEGEQVVNFVEDEDIVGVIRAKK